jgi:hypothetical protein
MGVTIQREIKAIKPTELLNHGIDPTSSKTPFLGPQFKKSYET